MIGIPDYYEGDARRDAAVSMRISKSKFCAGVQCLKRLYLLVHEPEIAAEPDGTADAIIEQGREVGLLARKLFPGGIEVCSTGLDQAIRTTRELVANHEVPAIFEGVFEHDGVLVRVDVLQRRKDERWRLIEVKSTTKVKDHHFEDVAIQHRVVCRSGVDLAASCLAHVSRDYVYEGGTIDASRFFTIRNLTRQVEKLQAELTIQLRSEFRVLAMSEAPNIPAGRQCGNPFTCEFFDHCNPSVPDDHILRLPRIHEFSDEVTGVGEWMWVRVTACDDAKRLVFGTSDNVPVNDATGKLKLGTKLAVSFEQIRQHQNVSPRSRRPIEILD